MAVKREIFPTISPIYRMPLVEEATGLKKTSIYKHIANGLFTKPISLGAGNRVGWPATEIRAIVDARIAGKTDDEIKQLVQELEARRGG